jgi:catechol 2,3-dioxygenase-like lactoylglutathione lyase family enzyme
VISGVHTILYAHDADAARAFFSEALGLESVDAGHGWLIFALPPGELACHPDAAPADQGSQGRVELYLMCTDIGEARRRLEARGVEFMAPVSDQGWGLLTTIRVPGFGALGLYEPRHPSPLGPPRSPA